jgi:outer membrane protein assembly factor BamB
LAALGLVLALVAGCKIESVEEPPSPKAPVGQPPAAGAAASEWPGWRGPDGTAFSPDVPRQMPAKKLLWSQAMSGECNAPLACAEGVVIAADYGAAKDHWRCFDAEKGTPLWDCSYENTHEMDSGSAPRATPLIHQGKAYLLDAFGTLRALDLKKGTVLWKKDFLKDFKAGEPATWGYCSSPLLAGGKLIVNPGGTGGAAAALDPDSGKVLWTSQEGRPNYASFIAGAFGGVEQVIGYDETSLGGWDLATGRRLFSLPVNPGDGYIVPAPVKVGDKVLLATEQGDTHLYAFESGGRIVQAPEGGNKDLYPEISTPVVWGDTILGATEGLVLLDPKDGLKTLWRYDEDPSVGGLVHFIVSKDRAIAFCDNGIMLLLAFDRAEARILGKEKLCGRTWVHPALAYGKLYVRDSKTLFCYDLAMKVDGGG